MIEPIVWNRRGRQTPSAFLKGQTERPLRVTFHTATFQNLSDDENKALELLLELVLVPELEALQTEPGILPHMDLGDFQSDTDYVHVKVIYRGKPRRRTQVFYPKQYYDMAVRLVSHNETWNEDVEAVFQDLLVARAHTVLDQDILITKSPLLLNHPQNVFVREANPRTILDAAKIIGLFLRNRDQYVYRIESNVTLSFDRGLFYWVLVRQRLPSSWRCFSACVKSSSIRKDDTLYVCQSVLTRCDRALQARDRIGEQFFIPQNNNTRDVMMYHFDYLTLLLAGALDAQAVIAHRVYELSTPEWRASFRQDTFKKKLRQVKANRLYALLTDQKNIDLLTILFELRNTIHRAALITLGYVLESPHSEKSYIEVDSQLASTLLMVTHRISTPEAWGFIEEGGVMIEPYSCATTLVQECIRLIDEIADATDVEALFMDQPIPELLNTSPEDPIFDSVVMKRLALLA